jgi:hypothetical protein
MKLTESIIEHVKNATDEFTSKFGLPVNERERSYAIVTALAQAIKLPLDDIHKLQDYIETGDKEK